MQKGESGIQIYAIKQILQIKSQDPTYWELNPLPLGSSFNIRVGLEPFTRCPVYFLALGQSLGHL